MAYISALDEEDEDKPAAASPVVAAAGAPGPVAAQPVPAASRFVNFSQYLNANRGGTQRAAQSITGDIEKQAQGVQNDLTGMQTQFRTDVQTGSNPTTGYTGPKDLAANGQWTDLQGRARKVEDSAAATASSGGIGAILQGQNRGAYGAGNRRLDTALTAHVGADDFAKARERYGKMSDALTQANAASTTAADTARDTTTAAKTAYDAEQAHDATVKQAAADEQLFEDVSASINAQMTKMMGRNPTAQHVADWLKYHEPRLKPEMDAKFGPGAWDRYVAIKEKRAAALRATYPGGV